MAIFTAILSLDSVTLLFRREASVRGSKGQLAEELIKKRFLSR
jgi:hypothetical protein